MVKNLPKTRPKVRFAPFAKKVFFSKAQYIGLRGGRSSLKTTTIAQLFITRAMEETARFLCTRELQKSIKDSSYLELQTAVERAGWSKYFQFKIDSIVCLPTNSIFIFIGLQAKPSQIKSKGLLKYCWVDEAQDVSQKAFSKLFPTIRQDDAQIFLTWNPTNPTDYVEKLFKNHQDNPKKLLVPVNYRQNPYWNDAMETERLRCQEEEPEIYAHIWEGEYCPAINQNPVLPYQKLIKCRMKIPEQFLTIRRRQHVYMGLDLANGGQDMTAYALREGSILYETEEKNLEDADKIADWIIPIAIDQKIVRCYYDVVGVGAGIQSQFATRKRKQKLTFITVPFGNNHAVESPDTNYVPDRTNGQFFHRLAAQGWWNLRLRMENTLRFLRGEKVNLERCLIIDPSVSDKTLIELAQVCFSCDSQDRITIDKKPDGEKSPNLAEAVMMSFARDVYFGLKSSM